MFVLFTGENGEFSLPTPGSAGRSFTDPILAAIPLSDRHRQQLTCVSFDYEDPTRSALVIIPVMTPSTLHYGKPVAEFISALSSCFPDATVPPAVTEPTEEQIESQLDLPVPPTPTILGDEHRHHHAPSDAYASSIKLVQPDALESAGVPASLAASLRHIYTGAPWAFVCCVVPPGKAALALAVVCATPQPGYLYVPTRSGLRYSRALATAPDGGCDCDSYVPWNVHIITSGSARRGDWAGGGKDPAAALDDMRHRFASGTFKVIVPPKYDWEELRSGPLALPEIRQLFASVASAPPGSSVGTALASAAEHAHRGHDGSGITTTTSTTTAMPAAGEPLPMHGRTSLPSHHNIGGHGFIAADGPPAQGSGGGGGGSSVSGSGTPPMLGGVVRRGVSFKGPDSLSASASTASGTPGKSAAHGGAGDDASGAGTIRRVPGVGCLDVLRQKKVALGPDVDLLVMLDYGTGQTETR